MKPRQRKQRAGTAAPLEVESLESAAPSFIEPPRYVVDDVPPGAGGLGLSVGDVRHTNSLGSNPAATLALWSRRGVRVHRLTVEEAAGAASK